MSEYIVETADGVGLVLTASTDLEAATTALRELKARGLWRAGLSLFRYPLCWVGVPKGWRGQTGNLIWVPMFTFLGT